MGLPDTPAISDVWRETQRRQAEAADPAASAWVSANAGTGKTHVLTMRVLRLLIAGTSPERILALTYTKAAAAEMSKRVFLSLGAWVTAGDRELEAALARLTGRQPAPLEIERARRLFAIAIETPGGLKVQTIHAFCERLLKRFPLEADVPPQFAILDEHQRRALLGKAVDAVLAGAARDPAAPLGKALRTAVAYAADDTFEATLTEALRESDWLNWAARRAADEGPAAVEADYRRLIGLRPGEQESDVNRQIAELISDDEFERLGDVLGAGGESDRRAEQLIALARSERGRARSDALQRLFLTDKGEPRKSLMTKALAAAHPDAQARLQRAQAAFTGLAERRLRLQLLDATLALIALGSAVMRGYAAAKARRAALDFDDLVARAASLLSSSSAVAWVLYKLDGGLDHILVDEAQDTSPQQWRLIAALAEEFFVGKGEERGARTLFAVGDEKQSIYGFQGAAPAMFAAMGRSFAERAERALLTFRRVPLNVSFRAVAPLLEAVDRVFACPERTRGVTRGATPEHLLSRAGEAGGIEIWPIEKRDRAEPAEPWSPLAETSVSSPVARLAARIAATIARWLADGEMLESEGRPVRAGDILILVRKRAPFAAAMVSALKARAISVAGADRLVLTEQIAVQDLLALGDFLMLPDDDLALATVLKSPLIGLDDDDLVLLAPHRSGSLLNELRRRAAAGARLRRAAETLAEWQDRAERMPPFEFYASLLDGGGGGGLRAAMLARLGPEAGDALDEFLSLALAYEDAAAPSLQGFLASLRADATEIKRDMEQGRDEVRVMTVHGAKGLEAPIVFLPDTCTTRSGRRAGGLVRVAGSTPQGTPPCLLWPVKGTSALGIVAAAKAAADEEDREERNRLLYVALTRARDRLYVAGYEGGVPPPEDCWYNLIAGGLGDRLEDSVADDGRRVRVMRCPQTAPRARAAAAQEKAAVPPLPEWARTPAPPPARLALPLAPARLAPLDAGRGGPAKRAGEGVLSPLALADGYRFLRGTLTHALLEHLPLLPRERWQVAAAEFIAERGAQLPQRVRREIVRETLAVLCDEAFGALFTADARAEVGIVAEIPRPGRPALRIAGKIDRLVRRGDALLIVDYKTNRPPPRAAAGVAEAYLLQLAAYRLAARRIFAGARVAAAILWTDGPRIMEIPEQLLDRHEERLLTLEAPSLDA
jgi:ATP-dependent helicase/nuclease subunit A